MPRPRFLFWLSVPLKATGLFRFYLQLITDFWGPILVRQKTMSRFESITIREVESSDLETFYEHQLDPEAIRMAAFVCEDPKDKVAFDTHWDRILTSSQITKRTIVAEGQSRWSHIVLSAWRKHRSHLLAWKGVLGKRISDSSAQ